jgi:dTDP-4-amino-4,6-dideoxygalactose transaminase
MKVPFLDIKAQYETLKVEILAEIQKVFESTAFAGGPFVKAFEDAFAVFCECKYAVGVGNGTDALWAALVALGVGPGDEVITVPNTFIATVEAISFCGAKPVFVDIEQKTYNMDPNLLEHAITPRTKAVIPVHLFGHMAAMDPILRIAKQHNLFVIEDASQAHGAEYKNRKAGSIGDIGCFSFYPGKNLGAYGEAGAVVTNNSALAEKVRMFRDHGQSKKYYHDIIGWNARMDGIQGAVLNIKLKYLPEWTEARRRNAVLYNKMISSTLDGIKTPFESENAKHVYHIYPILVRNREALITHLDKNGISSGIHYPVPVHLTDAYKFLGHKKGDFPVAEQCADKLVSLPMYPELTKDQIKYVVDSIAEFYH